MGKNVHMDTGVDGVHLWYGVLGVQGPENCQSDTCPKSNSRDPTKKRNRASSMKEGDQSEKIR